MGVGVGDSLLRNQVMVAFDRVLCVTLIDRASRIIKDTVE